MEGAKSHPVVIIAAIIVLLVSAMGAAALSGLLPAASSKLEDPATIAAREAGAPLEKQTGGTASQAAACAQCGVIESIRMVEIDGAGTGLGAVAGGVTGAVVGNQFGSGGGKTAMTVAGAAGGAYAGNTIEKRLKRTTAYRITLRMDDGTYRTLSQPEAPRFAVGERVRIAKGQMLERV